MTFYGVVTEIWELEYHKFTNPIIKCDCVDSKNGTKVDELEFTLIDLDQMGHRLDPFIWPHKQSMHFTLKTNLIVDGQLFIMFLLKVNALMPS